MYDSLFNKMYYEVKNILYIIHAIMHFLKVSSVNNALLTFCKMDNAVENSMYILNASMQWKSFCILYSVKCMVKCVTVITVRYSAVYNGIYNAMCNSLYNVQNSVL